MKLTIGDLKRVISEAVADDERSEIFSIYSDVFKEKHGVRPRHIDWREHSVEELQAMLDDIYEEPGDFDWGDFEGPAPEGDAYTFKDMEGTANHNDDDPYDKLTTGERRKERPDYWSSTRTSPRDFKRDWDRRGKMLAKLKATR